MSRNQLVHLYFCLEERSRKVVAAFSEYRIGETDERYVKRAHHTDTPGAHTEWVDVDGVPEELVSHKFDVYSMPINADTALDKYGFITALELFAKGEISEDYLRECANYIAHR